MKTKGKVITIITAVVVIALACFVYFRYYFVFGEGVKAGDLNFVVYKGYLFKTYEGQLIQAGFRSGKSGSSGGTIQSYEFNFSVADPEIAETLMHCGGKTVELHYKEYLGALPWRGKQKHVVCSIVNIGDQ